MKYLGHACIKAICWLSEIKIKLGILYFISNLYVPLLLKSVPPINHLNRSSYVKFGFLGTS